MKGMRFTGWACGVTRVARAQSVGLRDPEHEIWVYPDGAIT